MSTQYQDLFKEFLHIKHKYPKDVIRSNTYKYNGKEYGRVEVLSRGYIIQAFVLMDPKHCASLDKFPFHRTYSQWNDSGYPTPPACNVAVCPNGKDDWEIHSAADLRHEITSDDFLNYREAVKRFDNRLHYFGNTELTKQVRRLSRLSLIIVALYLGGFILSINDNLFGIVIPLDATMASILIIIVVLLLLPPLIPYIKLKWKGISLEIDQ